MNTLPEDGADDGDDSHRGEFGGRAAFDPAYVYRRLQEACRALESVDEHAAAAHVAQAMAMVHDRYGVGSDHLDAP